MRDGHGQTTIAGAAPPTGRDARAGAPPRPAPPTRPRRYLRVRTRVAISVALGLAWMALSAWLALPWIHDLGTHITPVAAWIVVAGIALVPGYLNMQLLGAVVMDHPRPPSAPEPYPDLAVIVAAFDEEARIRETLEYLCRSDYPGSVEFVVADDGSTDRTAELVTEMAGRDDRVRLVRCRHGGKAAALNAALATVSGPLVATIDADTLVMPSSLSRAVGRLLSMPDDTAAVAGAVMVRNSRASWLTRIQQWDYLVGIAAVKRDQSLLQGTLVAQGAFSVYRADALRRVGGWPDSIGEDIVLTWSMLRDGGRTGFEATAVAFTDAPTDLPRFVRQRRRWARGMIEGLRAHGWALVRRHRTWAHAVLGNMVFPYLDVIFSVAVPAGIVLACTGRFWIIGLLTLVVLPLNVAIGAVLFARQRAAFAEVGLSVRDRPRDLLGLAGYVLAYQLVMSPVSVTGYVAEAVHLRRQW
jgi:biofilm PGA synthesis N-glycosyltransferase PgaC